MEYWRLIELMLLGAHIRVSGFFVCVTTDCSEEQMVLFVYILGFEWHVWDVCNRIKYKGVTQALGNTAR